MPPYKRKVINCYNLMCSVVDVESVNCRAELGNNFLVCVRVELHTAARVALNLEWVDDREREAVLVELLTEARSTLHVLAIFGLALT